jgi:hypothetical protein
VNSFTADRADEKPISADKAQVPAPIADRFIRVDAL